MSVLLAAICTLQLTQPVAAAEPSQAPPPRVASAPPATRFLRTQLDAEGRTRTLDTAIVRYVSIAEPDLTVDLVAAIHIADPAYYAELDRLFADYDAVLYELVADGDAPAPTGDEDPSHPLRQVQDGITRVLDLSHQLDGVDYTASNFVHADMSPAALSRAMVDGGETPFTLFQRLLSQPIESSGNEAELFAALLAAPNQRPLRLKRYLAVELAGFDDLFARLSGERGLALLHDRNAVACRVLQQQLAAGRRRSAVFYGAAHMPDLERRLVELGFRRGTTRWLTAWRLD